MRQGGHRHAPFTVQRFQRINHVIEVAHHLGHFTACLAFMRTHGKVAYRHPVGRLRHGFQRLHYPARYPKPRHQPKGQAYHQSKKQGQVFASPGITLPVLAINLHGTWAFFQTLNHKLVILQANIGGKRAVKAILLVLPEQQLGDGQHRQGDHNRDGHRQAKANPDSV